MSKKCDRIPPGTVCAFQGIEAISNDWKIIARGKLLGTVFCAFKPDEASQECQKSLIELVSEERIAPPLTGHSHLDRFNVGNLYPLKEEIQGKSWSKLFK